jgi:hypothetical protein
VSEKRKGVPNRLRGFTQDELDAVDARGKAMEDEEWAERLLEYETSPAQREWEGHDDGCESEFISEAGQYSPCRCAERAEETP